MQRNGTDNTKEDFVPLVKPQSSNAAAPGISRCKSLLLFVAGMLVVAVAVFLFVGTNAEHSANPLKVLFKDCSTICKMRTQRRTEKFGGDPLDNLQLPSLILAARDKAIQSLKVDYGEKYFSEIFEQKQDGKVVIRKAFVPAAKSVSTERFKRKLQLKILQVQTGYRTQEKTVDGCDCVAQKPTTKKAGSVRSRRLQNSSDVSSAEDEEAFAKFIWTTGGHSAAAGHGNLYNESYTAYMERAIKDVFASVGIEFIGKNYAMGGMTSAPEIALCAEAIFGSDTDAVSWDYVSRV
jgi:hypothetical protein